MGRRPATGLPASALKGRCCLQSVSVHGALSYHVGCQDSPSPTSVPLPLSPEPAATPSQSEPAPSARPGCRESLGSVETLTRQRLPRSAGPLWALPQLALGARTPGFSWGLASLLGLFHLCELGGVSAFPPLLHHPPQPSGDTSSSPAPLPSARPGAALRGGVMGGRSPPPLNPSRAHSLLGVV